MTTDPYDLPDDPPAALGIVVDADRGSLPYALIHGEALVACAAWALGEAGVTLLDVTTPWSDVRTADQPLVLHDALCPMVPPAFVADCVTRAVASDVPVAAVRPLTDTVKEIDGATVGQTVDRDALCALASPVVLPASVVRRLAGTPGTDLVALVRGLDDVVLVEAPPQARRVSGEEDLQLLEALTAEERPGPGVTS